MDRVDAITNETTVSPINPCTDGLKHRFWHVSFVCLANDDVFQRDLGLLVLIIVFTKGSAFLSSAITQLSPFPTYRVTSGMASHNVHGLVYSVVVVLRSWETLKMCRVPHLPTALTSPFSSDYAAIMHMGQSPPPERDRGHSIHHTRPFCLASGSWTATKKKPRVNRANERLDD